MNSPLANPPLAFRAAELYLHDKLRIAEIVVLLGKEFPQYAAKINRETVYPLIQKARDFGFLRLVPPLNEKLAREVEHKYGCDGGSVRVVDCQDPRSNANVSTAAAEWAVELMTDLHKAVGGTIGVGLGPGRATRDFCWAFSSCLRENPTLPKLKLVAITAGGPARYPEFSSISYFNLFPSTSVDEKVGLFAETLVRSDAIEEIRTGPGCHEAFEAAKDIHLVVTSMGDMDDKHALLRMWYDECPGRKKPSWWKHAVGDIQYRPFANDRFIKEKSDEFRAVTLFDLEDMVALARRRDRHVILIARQCGLCEPRRTKATALLPILQHPEMRVFSRLVMDAPTAHQLIQA
jgi:DNA-binding transcriptional regulator LsrR (DeoR family)